MNIHNAGDDAENGRIKKGVIGEWDSLFVPNSIKVIEAGAYKGCTNIKEIEFEDGGESPLALYEEAFADCTGLQRVKLPARVETIQNRCFSGCIRLEDFEIEQGERPLCVGFFVFAECPNGGEMKTVVEEEQQARRERKTSGSRTGLQRENSQVLPQAIELINDLDKLIREHNPWTDLSAKMEKMVGQSWDAGFTNDPDVRFALDDDVEKIKEYNNKIQSKIKKTSDEKKRKEYENLLLMVNDQQPIPFIGHPEAKVWVLAMNPYYNPLEWCTFIKWDDYEARIRLQPGAKARPELRKCFEERQKLYAKSLNFSNEKDKRFYILDESMHVFEGDGNKDWTGYLWYGRHYLPDKETAYFQGDKKLVIASKELFALEYLPYPSTAFGDNYPIFRHTTFWAKLVKFALHNDKILIVRGRIMELVRRVDPEKFEEARKGGRILKFFNPQQISITRDNVGEYGARELEEYCDKLGK